MYCKLHPCFVLKKNQERYFVDWFNLFGKSHNTTPNRYQLLSSQRFLALSLIYCTFFNVVLNRVFKKHQSSSAYSSKAKRGIVFTGSSFLCLNLFWVVNKFVLKPSLETYVCFARQNLPPSPLATHSGPRDFTSQVVSPYMFIVRPIYSISRHLFSSHAIVTERLFLNTCLRPRTNYEL